MIPIQYVVGDATNPQGKGHKVIVHCCNDIGGWGAGFVLALSAKWPQPEEMYHKWFEQSEPQLGDIQVIKVENDISVCNMIGQHLVASMSKTPPIRYEAIKKGLSTLRDYIQHKPSTIHAPRFGTGLAKGRWDKIEMIIKNELSQYDISVTIYDLKQGE